MSQRSSGSTSRLHDTFHEICRYVGDLIFARDDDLARRCGWSVARTRHGLGRTYRDPRVDRLDLIARAAVRAANTAAHAEDTAGGHAEDTAGRAEDRQRPAPARRSRGPQRRRVRSVRCVIERSPRTPDGY